MSLKASLLFLISLSLLAQENTKRIKELLYKELAAAERLASKLDGVNPKLSYKVLESRYELFKIEFKEENLKFLKINPEEKIGKDKDLFFPNSRKLYSKVIIDAKNNIRIFKGTRYEYVFYYMMGAIANDFSKFDKAIFYLSRVIQLAQKRDGEYYNAMDILAELYFNKKQFRKAKPLYGQLLKLTQRPSYHRHLYNYSWILLNSLDKQKALNNLIKVINYKEKNADRIIIQQSIEQSPVFFVEAKKVLMGAKILIRRNPAKLIDLIRLAISKGLVKSAFDSYILVFESKAKVGGEVKFNLEVLNLYETNNQIPYAKKVLKKIKDNFKRFSLADRKDIVNKLRSYLENNRKFFVDTKYSENKLIKLKVDFAYQLISILKKVDKQNLFEYLGFKSETLKYEGKVENSYLEYMKTARIAIKYKKQKWYHLTLDLAFAILNEKDILKKKYYGEFSRIYIKYGKTTKIKEAILNDLFIESFQQRKYKSAASSYHKLRKLNVDTKKYEQSFYLFAFEVKSVKAIKSRLKILKKLGVFKSQEFIKESNLLLKNIKLGVFNKISKNSNSKQLYALYLDLKRDNNLESQTELQLLTNILTRLKKEGIEQRIKLYRSLSDRWVQIAPVSSSYASSFMILAKDHFYRNDLSRFREISMKLLNNCQKIYLNDFLVEFAPFFFDGDFKKFYNRFLKCGLNQSKLNNFTLNFFWSDFVKSISLSNLDYFISIIPQYKKEVSRRLWLFYLNNDLRDNNQSFNKLKSVFESDLIEQGYKTKFKNHQSLINRIGKVSNYKSLKFSKDPSSVQNLIAAKIEEVNGFNTRTTKILNGQEAGIQFQYLKKIMKYNRSFINDLKFINPFGLSDEELIGLRSALQPVISQFIEKNALLKRKTNDLRTLGSFSWTFFPKPIFFDNNDLDFF